MTLCIHQLEDCIYNQTSNKNIIEGKTKYYNIGLREDPRSRINVDASAVSESFSEAVGCSSSLPSKGQKAQEAF